MSTMGPPTPVLVALLVCDTAIQDSQSKKYTLVGVFSEITAHNFPAIHSSAWLYAKLIGCEGEYITRVDFARVSDQKVIISGEGNLIAHDRHASVDCAWSLPRLPLEVPGEYEFRLWMNDKFISNVRVTARQV